MFIREVFQNILNYLIQLQLIKINIKMVDVGNTLLYIFYSVLQIYILLSPGFLSYFKKLLTPVAYKMISNILFNFIIPIYSMMEISRVSSIEKLSKYWMLAILTLMCLLLRLFISKIIAYIFDIDKKVLDGYVLLNTFPAIGAISIIIGTNLCNKNCPLDGDELCEDILGLMMILFMMNFLVIFIVGLIVAKKSKFVYDSFKEKLLFLYYRLITEINSDDLTAKHLIYKYIEDERTKEQIYIDFKENNSLICDEEFDYVYITKNNNQQNTENNLISKNKESANVKSGNVIDLVVENTQTHYRNTSKKLLLDRESSVTILPKGYIKKTQTRENRIKQHHYNNLRYETHENEELIIINSSFTNLKRELNLEILHKNIEISEELIQKCLRKSKLSKIRKRKNRNNESSCKSDNPEKSFSEINSNLNRLLSNYSSTSKISQISLKERSKSFAATQSIKYQKNLKYLYEYVNNKSTLVDNESFINNIDRKSLIDYYEALFDIIDKHLKNLIIDEINKNIDTSNIMILNMISDVNNNNIPIIINTEKIVNDSQLFLKIIENSYSFKGSLNTITRIYKEMLIEKKEIMTNLTLEAVPKFFAVDSLKIDSKGEKVINEYWEKFLTKTKKHNIQLNLQIKELKISFYFVINQLMNPPVISCILGIFLGVSGLRDVIFSSNHYITNLYLTYRTASTTFVPLLCVNAGFALANSPKINLNFSITKKQTIISFIVWLILFPIIGYCVILLFDKIYGKLITTSKVFRFSIFIPYSLPVTTNLVILLNVVGNFYLNEYAYILGSETKSMFITQTLLLLIYFVIEG